MVESLGLGTKSSGPEANTKTSSWFRLPIPKPGFGRTLIRAKHYSIGPLLEKQQINIHISHTL